MCDSTRRDLEVKMYIIFIREILISMIMKHQGKVSNLVQLVLLPKVESPTLPAVAVSALTYGNEIKGLDLGQSTTLSYTLTGLPPGLTNETIFSPNEVPGLYAWYDADANDTLVFMTRNPTTVMIPLPWITSCCTCRLTKLMDQ